jgi:primary-amine oxidase
MWPAGKYVPQTRETPEDSIGEWVKGGESIEGEDILVYLTVGVTHIPRPEDWPVYVYFSSSCFSCLTDINYLGCLWNT